METSAFLSSGKLLGSDPAHSSLAFPGLKTLETERFDRQGQTRLIQRERNGADLRPGTRRAEEYAGTL